MNAFYQAPKLEAVAVLGAVLLLACAPRPHVSPSGFLGDYSDFVREDGSETLIYEKPGVTLKPYSRVLLEPVHVTLDPKAGSQPVDPAELAALADYLHDALVIAVRDAYPLADAPAPDVLTLRILLTDVVPTKPALNTAGNVLLPVRAASAAKRAVTGTDLFVGQVAIEAELLDSVSGERLIAIVDRKVGTKFQLSEGTTTWGHVAKAFREWAVQFRLRMDRERR
jgi:hypothetical protein